MAPLSFQRWPSQFLIVSPVVPNVTSRTPRTSMVSSCFPSSKSKSSSRAQINAILNPQDDPIVKEALKFLIVSPVVPNVTSRTPRTSMVSSCFPSSKSSSRAQINAILNPQDDPIVKEALKFLIVSPVVPNVTSRTPRTSMVSSCFPSSKSSSRAQINAILNPQDDPIVKEALKFLIVSPVVPNVTSRTPRTSMVSSCFPSSKSSGRAQINAILNPQDDPIVKEALKFLIVSPVVPNVTSRTPRTSMVSSCFPSSKSSGRAQINAILNPQDDPIVKEALKFLIVSPVVPNVTSRTPRTSMVSSCFPSSKSSGRAQINAILNPQDDPIVKEALKFLIVSPVVPNVTSRTPRTSMVSSCFPSSKSSGRAQINAILNPQDDPIVKEALKFLIVSPVVPNVTSRTPRTSMVSSCFPSSKSSGRAQINAILNPQDDPIVKEALKFLIVSPVVPNVTSRTPRTSMVSSCFPSSKGSGRAQINAILNPQDDPIVKEALKFLIVSPVVPNVTSRTPRTSMVSSCFPSSKSSGRAQINAILNPQDDPIVKEALKFLIVSPVVPNVTSRTPRTSMVSSCFRSSKSSSRDQINAILNPQDDPIVKEALKFLIVSPVVPNVTSRTPRTSMVSSCFPSSKSSGRAQINAILNPQDDPIVKEALKEPVAFLGGVFAGLLRLDLSEDPLRDWVERTSKAAGLENMDVAEVEDETPEEISIE